MVLLASGCGERFPATSQESEFARTPLLEEGTGTWCVYCPEAAENIQTLLDADTGKIVVLALHKSDDYSTDETEARLERLGVQAYPAIIFDGVEPSGREVGEMQEVLEERRNLGSPLKLELSASLSSDSAYYQIKAIASSQLEEPLEGNLRIALVEDTLTDPSVGLLYHTVRRFPEITGADQLLLEPGDTAQLERVLPLDASWGRPLSAAAWVQNTDLKVYQAVSSKIEDGPQEPDFVVEPESDTTAEVSEPGDSTRFYFKIGNNTDSTVLLHLGVSDSLSSLPQGWDYYLADESQSYPHGIDIQLEPDESSPRLHLTVTTSPEAGQARLVLLVTKNGTEVSRQTFTLESNLPDPGNFSIKVTSDTLQTDTLGGEGIYYFTLGNHTQSQLTLTVDMPEDSLQLPQGWGALICDADNCYFTPFDVEVSANSSSQEFHLTITSTTDGSEGMVVLAVTDGSETDRQTFVLRVK